MVVRLETDRARKIIEPLKREYPEAKVALSFSNPWELLVATILSAQCTDKKVSEVTKHLFRKYPTIQDYANALLDHFEQDIKVLGLYRNKAKNILSAARLIIEKFDSEVPRKMEEILTLPGVARKTANIVLGNAYEIVEGIAVDTHVKRLSIRLGLTNEKDTNKIEKDLMKIFPRKDWFSLNYLLIEHGRALCKTKNPLCESCVLNALCPSANLMIYGRQGSKKVEFKL